MGVFSSADPVCLHLLQLFPLIKKTGLAQWLLGGLFHEIRTDSPSFAQVSQAYGEGMSLPPTTTNPRLSKSAPSLRRRK